MVSFFFGSCCLRPKLEGKKRQLWHFFKGLPKKIK